jgi:N-acetylgalactosamine 4-sulfate 6-O-sulfotransferase
MLLRLPRAQNVLLLAIAVLLTFNILLPARYTLQIVRKVPATEAEGPPPTRQQPARPRETPETPAVHGSKPSLVRRAGHNYENPPAIEKSGHYRELDWQVTRIRNDAPWEGNWGAEEYMERRQRSRKEMMALERQAAGDGKEKVNLHDPAQRMAYYKRLRRRLSGGVRSWQDQRAKRRMEMVREMWDGWFEENEISLQLEGLTQHTTEDITPEALHSELSECALAIGVSQERLESQKDSLRKTSTKLSAFLSAVKSLVPDSFSPDFKSPCWYTNRLNTQSNLLSITSRVISLEGHLQILPNQASYLARQAFSGSSSPSLFCLPRFFLAGFPKSATTTLADVLFSHPQVSSATAKELHWWTRAPIISPNESLLRLNVLRYLINFWHLAHYAAERPGLLAMDGSQSTLWDSNFVFDGRDFCSTPAAISHVLPDAKFIVLMREPSERLYSYYLWSCSYRYGNDTENWPDSVRNNPAGNFHSEVSETVADFNHCLETSSLYECTNRFTFKNSTKGTHSCGQTGFRLVVSLYYIHIAKFLQFFPREHFLFLKMEDMANEPIPFMHRVTDFLGIAPYPAVKVRDALERKHNRQKAGIGQMHDETRQLLHDFFAPHNRQLVELLGDHRFLWEYS